MGNEVGKNTAELTPYGGIFLKLNDTAYYPDDTLSGTIYLNLIKPYPGDKLCLEIKGKETVKWIDKEARHRDRPDGTRETYYVDVPREGEVDVINQELVVYDWISKQTTLFGQYTLPFAFKIPHGLPGSFFLKRGNAVAEIKYSVEAFLKPEVDTVPKLKHKERVVMKEKFSGSIEQREVSLTKNMSTWCCIGAGSINLRTAFEKNAYLPNETARILTEVDNSKCTLNITDVVFNLNQSIHISDGKGHGTGFSFPIRSVNLGSISAGESCLGDKRKEASIQLPAGQEGSAKEFTGEHFEFDPTKFITPSTHGKLIKSDFSLGVTCQIDGCLCCETIPSNSLQIQVYSLPPVRRPDPTPPPNWNPQQMPQQNLTISIVSGANGNQEVRIDTGAPNMLGGQMPQQGGPNIQINIQKEQAKPNNQPIGSVYPQQPVNNSYPQQQPQQPSYNNSYPPQQQPLNNSPQKTQPLNTGYPPQQQQPMNTSYPQQQPLNTGYPPQQQPQQPSYNNSYPPQQQPLNNGYPQQQQPLNTGYPPQQPINTGYPQQQPYNNDYPPQQQQQPVYNTGYPQQSQPVNIQAVPHYQQQPQVMDTQPQLAVQQPMYR